MIWLRLEASFAIPFYHIVAGMVLTSDFADVTTVPIGEEVVECVNATDMKNSPMRARCLCSTDMLNLMFINIVY